MEVGIGQMDFNLNNYVCDTVGALGGMIEASLLQTPQVPSNSNLIKLFLQFGQSACILPRILFLFVFLAVIS